MHTPYDPSVTESKWQKKWEEAKAFHPDLKKAKDHYYALVMFPYPSGDKLHVGHWYNYSPADTHARYMRMHGKTVFSPLGFDAFGLPAENYAIKTGVPPQQSITQNVATMIEQLKKIGCMYDWERTVNTSTPEYYKWTQWLFLQMFQHGLAYKKQAYVNYCPKDQTVLANEQVHDGKCERCGTEVVQKSLEQWFWKITQYAQQLLDGLEDLEWPQKTKLMQQNWIGRSEGAEIRFKIDGHEEELTVFTTRPDTLFGATYLVLAPEHPLVGKITPEERWGVVHAYRELAKKKTELQRTELEKSKTGEPTGAFAIHPVTGDKIPVWVADYVLMNYGTGAIMAVPGHDERDWEFAQKYELPVKRVVAPEPTLTAEEFKKKMHAASEVARAIEQDIHDDKAVPCSEEDATDQPQKLEAWEAYLKSKELTAKDKDVKSALTLWSLFLSTPRGNIWLAEHADSMQAVHAEPGIAVNSEFLDGLTTPEAKKRMIAWLEDKECGRSITQFRLRDWLVSRQRYWGAPIPIVYDPSGKPHPVPEKHLPWLLPEDVEFKPTGQSPLVHSKELKERTEKLFGEGWTPEVDTMDTFVCSSFYFLRYLMEGDTKKFVAPTLEKKWMPVDMYIGGPEHACMHLIYARFVMRALHDFGVVSHPEPFKRLVHQGLITSKGAKMSKSKGNVVSPDSFVSGHGSDVFRMYLMFMGPFTDGGDWSDQGIKGIDRFVQRVWKTFGEEALATQSSSALQSALHLTIKKVTESFERFQFNTAISALMEFLNKAEGSGEVTSDTAHTFIKLLSPLAPHLAEELWEKRGGEGFVMDQQWPIHDPKLLVSDTMTIAIQVNGKLRGQMQLPSDSTQEQVIAAALSQENVTKFLEGKTPKKEIYVKGKLVNLVI